MEKMKIEVWTDIMCPYCYIGKIHYEKALSQFEHADEIEIVWKAFQLNPDLPDKGNGYPVKEYLTFTAGIPEEDVNRMFKSISKLAEDVDIKFNLDNALAANTRDAHRLIKMAATIGKDTFVLGELSKAYFEEAKDYSDHDLLVAIGTEAGLDEQSIRAMFDSNDYLYDIKQDMQEASNLGFDTVPTFLMDERQAIVGSEPISLYVKVLNKSYNDWKKRAFTEEKTKIEVTRGLSCDTDGMCEI